MKKYSMVTCFALAALVLMTAQSDAQSLFNGFDTEGYTTTLPSAGRIKTRRTVRSAIANKFSPHRLYAHSNPGNLAGLTHQWNETQAQSREWHGNYGHWRYNQPTALVVPATASYQMTYGWGVGGNRSLPIHHQFGRGTAGITGGGPGSSQQTPLFPSHSDQNGVYSVRAPW